MSKITRQVRRQFVGCIIIRYQLFHFLAVFCQKRLIGHQMIHIVFKIKEDCFFPYLAVSVEGLQIFALRCIEMICLINTFHQRNHLVNFRTVDRHKTTIRKGIVSVKFIERLACTIKVDITRKVLPHGPIRHSV